ncbi:hypothetical protein D6861_010445 [Macrococcoides caseolyticum]|nr:hypothetical protein [Macrococcus caseolyticus]RKO14109.1 hypothetical protein D6861_08385 [Macrococcus caseolyticus]
MLNYENKEILNQQLSNQEIQKEIIKKNSESLNFLKEILDDLYKYKDQEAYKNLYKIIDELHRSNSYYLNYLLTPDGTTRFIFIDKNFKGLSVINITNNGGTDFAKSIIKKYHYTVQIVSLFSFENNKGKEMVNYFKVLSKKTGIPIILFDKNSKGKNYYKDQGFKFSGESGDRKEELLVFYP